MEIFPSLPSESKFSNVVTKAAEGRTEPNKRTGRTMLLHLELICLFSLVKVKVHFTCSDEDRINFLMISISASYRYLLVFSFFFPVMGYHFKKQLRIKALSTDMIVLPNIEFLIFCFEGFILIFVSVIGVADVLLSDFSNEEQLWAMRISFGRQL